MELRLGLFFQAAWKAQRLGCPGESLPRSEEGGLGATAAPAAVVRLCGGLPEPPSHGAAEVEGDFMEVPPLLATEALFDAFLHLFAVFGRSAAA